MVFLITSRMILESRHSRSLDSSLHRILLKTSIIDDLIRMTVYLEMCRRRSLEFHDNTIIRKMFVFIIILLISRNLLCVLSVHLWSHSVYIF